MKESRLLWLVYLPFIAVLYWIGSDRFHNKETLYFFIVFMLISFLVAPVFKFFWLRDGKRRQK